MATIVAWSLLLVGGLVVVCSLYADRSRGRRRCPRCHYDMSQLPGLRCQECGRRQPHEGRFYRTRRHWRWCVAGVGLMLLAWAAAQVPRVRSEGWVAVTPAWWMIWQFERLDDLGPAWPSALSQRIGRERTWDATRRLLVRRAIGVAGDPDADVRDRLRAIDVIKRSEDTGGHQFYREAKQPPRYNERVSSFSVDFPGA
ncbi:MAG: hypothetical protein AAGA55_03785 [Planctomycetota bacterium]